MDIKRRFEDHQEAPIGIRSASANPGSALIRVQALEGVCAAKQFRPACQITEQQTCRFRFALAWIQRRSWESRRRGGAACCVAIVGADELGSEL